MSSHALSALENRLGHTFSDRRLLHTALTHRSFGAGHNERLEFLGDAVLNLCVAALLYDRGVLDEGRLSYWRSDLVRAETLARIARDLRLGDQVLMSDGQALAGGARHASILADALEAVIGAVFLDSGFDAARAVVERLYADPLANLDPSACIKDPKTRLQEWLQARRLALPVYTAVRVDGPEHRQAFQVRCECAAGSSEGRGPTRRAAEQQAASGLLAKLEPAGAAAV